VPAVIQAAAISFGFVFIHPFLDGNGRLHRLLIHYILARTGFTPAGLIFPISAVMLRKMREYDDCLESFSGPLMQLVDYDYDPQEGSVQVQGGTHHLYRYIDYTRMAEDLFRWIRETIRTEFREELEFVVNYRKAREEMEQVVELPDQKRNLFVRLCLQNGGRLSATKRASHFSQLSDEEVHALERIVQQHLTAGGGGCEAAPYSASPTGAESSLPARQGSKPET
ncbi:MAG TPA: Fic family protein, partial [Myxococcaceae bacterium]|nr:Fic family protein [Myxococcaceae bacterium]